MTQAGNGSRRTMAIEMAWGWVRFQPERRLTQWYQARCGQGRARLRTMGIVALARKFLIALWRVLRTGVLPAGAGRKVEVASEPIPARPQVSRRGRTGFELVWTTRWGARVRSANRLGGGVVHSGLHRQAPRAPAGAGACPSAVTTERRSFGARELHGSRRYQPRARDPIPSGLPQGRGGHEVGKTIKRA